MLKVNWYATGMKLNVSYFYPNLFIQN